LRGKFWCRPAAVTQDRKHPTIDGQEELEKRQQGDAPGMKENVLDVLMYLFETYIDAEEEPEPDQNELRDELSRAGFGDSEIDRALDWLDGLTDNHEGRNYNLQTEHGTRIYNEIENDRLNSACRGFITYLEQIGILSPPQREILIDRLLALETPDIDVEQIKWVVLMVLFSQPGQELAYARMEDLVFDEGETAVH
jgi:Smg protein